MSGIDEMIDGLNQTTQGLKASSNLEEIIGIIRSELYTYFANMNAQQKQMVDDNKLFIQNLGDELKRIIGDDNKKSESLRREIHAYLENNNRLFKEVAGYLKEISVKVSKPTLIPPPLEIPNEMLRKLDRVVELLEKTHGELEGLYFIPGQKKITRNNTPERLADKRRTKSVVVIAESDNSSTVLVGGRGLRDSTAGAKLRPGESFPADIDLQKRELYISGQSGDGVTFVLVCYKPETMYGGSR